MNKYIKRVEAYKEKTLQKAIDKLNQEKYEATSEFYATGYRRFQNKIDRIEKETLCSRI